LRRILGAKTHSSVESLNVISNVIPVRIRIQELCTREYMRMLQKPTDSRICILLSSTVSIRNKFTPMAYIKYVARDFQRSLDNMEIEKETKVTDEVILDDIAVRLMPLAADLGGTSNRTSQQNVEGKDHVESFVEAQRGKSVMIFTDGSVNAEYSGIGSCAALLVPLGSCESEVQQSEVFSVLADSTEAEVCGIALALDMAIQYFCTQQQLDYRESLFVLSDRLLFCIIEPNRLFVHQDLTPKQREARRRLVSELKQRQTNGESNLMIVNGKIVQRKNRNAEIEMQG